MTTWCSLDDVTTYANTTVEPATLTQAGATIDVHCARPYDLVVGTLPDGSVCQISAADLYWLRLACAYQAAWLSTQPDAFSRSDVTSVGRGTGSLTIADSALVLAPLAKVTLRRVSFLKSRSLHVPGAMEVNDPWLDEDGAGWRDLGPV